MEIFPAYTDIILHIALKCKRKKSRSYERDFFLYAGYLNVTYPLVKQLLHFMFSLTLYLDVPK